MKKGIHPEYKPTTIVCSCGNEIQTRSTQDEIHVEICAVCHPFYTGRQKLVDTAGRVERFNRKYGDVSSGAGEEEESREAGDEASSPPEAAGGSTGEDAGAEGARAPQAVAAATAEAAGAGEETAGEEEAEEAGESETED